MARLNITAEVYYDLTTAETSALLRGVSDRELAQLRQTRTIATLLRNAPHFKGAGVTEAEYMPLPGDEEIKEARKKAKNVKVPPNVMLDILAQLLPGCTVTKRTDIAES